MVVIAIRVAMVKANPKASNWWIFSPSFLSSFLPFLLSVCLSFFFLFFSSLLFSSLFSFFSFLCFSLLCCSLLFFALLCCSLRFFALLCCSLLFFAFLCFALLFFAFLFPFQILNQVRGMKTIGTNEYRGVVASLAQMYKIEGVRGFFKGNGTNVIRIAPYSAIQFLSYERYKRFMLQKMNPPGKSGRGFFFVLFKSRRSESFSRADFI